MSFTPPPWDELTTSEPSLRATLVSPPGTNFLLRLPMSVKGLKSTCRGERDLFLKIGTDDKSRIGWAI